MEQNLSHIRERGSFAPFVGVALAALTAGSLVLFSVIAQRTSHEGFPSRGVAAAPAPLPGTTGSITLPAVPEADSSEDAEADQTAEPDASELLFVSDDEPAGATTGAVQGDQGAPSEAGAPIAQDGDAEVAADANALAPFFRMAAGGLDNGEVEVDADAKKANGRDGDKKDKKVEKAKKDKKSKKAKTSRRSGSRGRSAHGNRGRSSKSASASSRRPSKPASSSKSARSSKSAHASRSSAPKARPASNHQNGKGKGHSKGRGKGHRH